MVHVYDKVQQNIPVSQFLIGEHKNLVYLLLDWRSEVCAMIDVHHGHRTITKSLRASNLELEKIFLTHTHWDHIHGLAELIKDWPKLEVFVHPREIHRIEKNIRDLGCIVPLNEGDEGKVGNWKLSVLHTPGHSPGECCYFERELGILFTGDTLFIRDCGRTDLEGGSDEEMFRSLSRLKLLPASTQVFPGHQYKPERESTLESELKSNPALRCETLAQLKALE